MNKTDMTIPVTRGELRDELVVFRQELRDELVVFRQDLRDELVVFRQDLRDEFASKQDLHQQLSGLEQRLGEAFAMRDATLAKHGEMHERHEATLANHSATLANHSATLAKHSEMLEKQGATLAKHSEMHERHEATLAKHSEMHERHERNFNLLLEAVLARIDQAQRELGADLARHTRAIEESMQGRISTVDDKYKDLPDRVKRLETTVLSSRRR
jgi:hypothetical protein